MNKAILIGNVGRDPNVKYNLVFRNGLAQTVEKYVHKGDKLYVEGKIFTRNYDDQSGIKRYVTEIYVDEMEMLTPKSSSQSAPTAPQPVAQPAAPATQPATDSAEDLPF